MAKWSLNLRSEPPSWWTEETKLAAFQAAESALPNETCGLFYEHLQTGEIQLQVFAGNHSPSSCYADPKEVVSFAYRQEGLGFRILATFHTHPQGQSFFSSLDSQLSDWSTMHLLLFRKPNASWEQTWGVSSHDEA